MPEITVLDSKGAKSGKVKLDDFFFDMEPNPAVLHQVVTAQLAAKRAGTHSTKTRSTARGGGRKPWRQKGTGRARQGSIRAPHWKGGGVAHGPQPRSYAQKTPKKMRAIALRSALSDRARDSKVLVVKDWDFADAPSTKAAATALKTLGVEGRILIILPRDAETVRKSFRNLPSVHILPPDQLNTYDVLVSDFVVFTQSCLDLISVGEKKEPAASKESDDKEPAADKKPAASKEPAAKKEPAADKKPAASKEPAADEEKSDG